MLFPGLFMGTGDGWGLLDSSVTQLSSFALTFKELHVFQLSAFWFYSLYL